MRVIIKDKNNIGCGFWISQTKRGFNFIQVYEINETKKILKENNNNWPFGYNDNNSHKLKIANNRPCNNR